MKVEAAIYYGSSKYAQTDLPTCDWSLAPDQLVAFWFTFMVERGGNHYGSMSQRVGIVRHGSAMVSITGNGWSVMMSTPEWDAAISKINTDADAILRLMNNAERNTYTPERVLALMDAEVSKPISTGRLTVGQYIAAQQERR
jgi:hypothetical protein